jgi:GxxExxY protein
MTKIVFDELSNVVIGCALTVHKELGPGLLEKVYQQALAYELSKKGLNFELEKQLPVLYKGVHIDCGFRLDLLVEDKLLLELKCVEKILPIHKAQILTYLKLANKKTGLLINFYTKLLKNGITRFKL